MSYRTSLKSCVLATSSAAVIGAALAVSAGAPAFAQDAAAGDRVVVTGSRIVRRDFVANSPIVTVDSSAFESQNGLNIESYLNELPQFNPAASPVTSDGDVQSTAVNSVGIASISLRGLGANRNLVLVDGKRVVPVNALGVTDINSIPSALIQRVEIITGGASAVYGADAVGGVVNFILRDDFDGVEIDSQYGITEAGDGEEFRISAVMGSNFANGRGNVTIGGEHYSRSAAYERNRDWIQAKWADPVDGGTFGGFVFGRQAYTAGGNGPTLAAVNTLFAGRAPGDNICSPNPPQCANSSFSINANGTVYTNAQTGLYRFDGVIDNREYGLQTVYEGAATAPGGVTTQLRRNLRWNNVDQLLSSPQTRYSMFASGSYDITDSLEFFFRGTWSESKTRTQLFPANATAGWEVRVPYNPTTDSPILPGGGLDTVNPNFIPTGAPGAQHPVSPEVAYLLNSRAIPVTCPAGSTASLAACNAAIVAAGGTAAVLPFAGANVTLTAAAATAPASALGIPASYNPVLTGPLAVWQMDFYPTDWVGDRSTYNTISQFQFETGLRGELPFRDWTWELYVAHGETATYTLAGGSYSLERYRALVQAPDYGRNATFRNNVTSNGLPTVRPGFGSAIVNCTSGFYDTIFRGGVPTSQDCIDAFSAPLQARTQTQQNIGELNLQGGLFDLPAGEIRGALGFQYRENNVQYYPDILQSTISFRDQVIGVYPTAYMDASTHARESYVELLVPVLSDLPFIQQFDLELGARYSDYDVASNEWTYKILADWSVNDWLRFRGGYNRATRAPNIGELFLGRQEFFAVEAGVFGDPCGLRSPAPFGAGGAGLDPVLTAGEVQPTVAPGQTAAGAASTRLICEAQMGPATANIFYNVNNAGGAGTGAAFSWLYQEGNRNLDSEKADTWTAGFVASSPFDNPWLSNITLSVDWYKLEIADAIQQYTTNHARFLCYGAQVVSTPAAAAARAASPECQNVGRDTGVGATAGGALQTRVAYDNQATIETSGVDVALNWSSQFEDIGVGVPGGLGINIQASFLDYFRTKTSPATYDPIVDWKGSLGPNLSGINPGAYDYRLFTTLSYFVNDLSFSLRWRHLPEVDSIGVAQQRAVFANNQLAVAGSPDHLLQSFTPSTALAVKAYDMFDLSMNWNLNETLSLRAGIDNIFDRDPNRTAASTGRPHYEGWTAAQLATVCDEFGGPGRTATGAVAPGVPGPLGCATPGAPSLPGLSTGVTNAGFYDVLGRRFFVGVKARF